jgi:RNA polymerase subunit RPABC4/transcription elongation factor Spt4
MSESLVPCKSCKNPVSTKANNCPTCGRGRPGGGTSTWIFVLFTVVLVLFALWLI